MERPQTSYGEAQARRYDRDFLAVFGGLDRGDLTFFREEVARGEGAICEVGAGTGRVLCGIAAATGARPLIGVEPSPWMRSGFEERLRQDPALASRVEVKDGEFLRIPLADRSVGVVFSAFRSFQHVLEVEEQVAALEEMKRVLVPGGRLMLDAFDPPYAMLTDTPERLGKRYRLADGTLVARYESRKIVREKQRVDVTLRWTETRRIRREAKADSANDIGRRLTEVVEHRETYGVRYIFPFELQHLLHRVGLREVEIFGAYDRTPVTAVPRELVAVARR